MKHFIYLTLANRLLIAVFVVGLIGAGLVSFRSLPVDAFPDVTPALVQVFTETEGLAPEEVERYVTFPVEVAMNGLPNLKQIRSTSNFGLSVVNIYFEDGTDIYFARQLVGERLQIAREEIPEGFGEPAMGPITTGLGQILFFFVADETGTRDLRELREAQDWIIKYNLQTVPGVTEVLSLGGEEKQYQVLVQPDALLRYKLTVNDVADAIAANNANVGAQSIVRNAELLVVRSVGLASSIADIENIVVKVEDGTPIYVRDVAGVHIGGAPRQGLAVLDGRGEAVAGLVLKLIDTNTSTVIDDVKKRLSEINAQLPEGLVVVPYYDQSVLVAKCIETVTSALLEGIVLVSLVLLVFLGAVRPALVVALSIPFCIAFTFLAMNVLGISANLMSMGGLAIAIGLLVDGSIVIVENIDRLLKGGHWTESKREIVARAAAEVLRPITFALIIIIVVFIPLFTLQGVEGKTFRPLAYTLALAMLGSLVFAALVTPVAAELLMRRPEFAGHGKTTPHDPWLVRRLLRGYRPLVTYFVGHRRAAIVLAVAILVGGGLVLPRIGSEFVPRLNEGDLLVRVTMAPSISLEEARDTVLRFGKRLMSSFPEVTRVVTRVGRGEVGAHADPINSAEAFVALRPQEEWTSADTPDALYAKMAEAFEDFPGAQFNFTQPIAAAVDELLTGTRAQLAVKLFGPDSDILQAKSAELEAIVRGIGGASDVQRDQLTGAPQLRIVIDRNAIARYGLNVDDVQAVLSTAVGGRQAGQVFEEVRRFDIVVRYAERARATPEAIREIIVRTPRGEIVPLSQLAVIEEVIGPRQVTRENNQRFATVQANVRGRDIGSFVAEGKQIVAQKLQLPPGYFVEWGGQFELQEEANARFAVVIPLTLGLIFFLLFMNFGSLKSAGLIMLNIPLALVGGIVGLWITGQNLSVPASVGFIALFGIAVGNGMVLVTYLDQLVREGRSIDDASIEGGCLRFRPVLMTATAAMIGLVPLLFATGTGSEVQRPLATVVVGGLITATVLTLVVIPSIYKWFAVEQDVEETKSDSQAESVPKGMVSHDEAVA
ncbi:MAG: efflux RND transporter permease subunit [Rhodospirillales bacterium]|nr:efflux RND transporter permease subunit [Rhodospirillales bacterium]